MGRRGEVFFYQYAIQFFEDRIGINELTDFVQRLIAQGYIDGHLSNLIPSMIINLSSGEKQNEALKAEFSPSKRRLLVLRMLGYREGEADSLLKTSRLFHGSGTMNSLKEITTDKQNIMLSAFLEGPCFYFRGGDTYPSFEPLWFYYCPTISIEQIRNVDSFVYGKLKYFGDEVGLTVERAKNHYQISITSDKMMAVEASNWYEYLKSIARELRFKGDLIFTIAEPLLQNKSSRIYRLTIIKKWSERVKLYIYLRIFSTRTEEVGFNESIFKHPVLKRQMVIQELNQKFFNN